ncbi:MAG TPA: hypothetical protein VMV49_02400 [Candidatus Deferrimicrobium sp.]|nr:hypothetical protein [Candidatus Deferrimicrobium sp.]
MNEFVNVEKYHASWFFKKHKGTIYLFDANHKVLKTLEIEDPTEFLVAIDLMRNEKPIWYYDVETQIATGAEPTGEEEG